MTKNSRTKKISDKHSKEFKKFLVEYRELRKEREWIKIVVLCEKEIIQITKNEERIEILLKLANAYYNLDQYHEAYESAKKAIFIEQGSTFVNLRAHNLCLLANICKKLSGEYREQSKEFIVQALEMANHPKLEKFNKAKIYSYAGNIEYDVNKNFEAAIEYYNDAMKDFAKIKDWNQHNITAIKKARCHLELDKLKPCKNIMNEISKKLDHSDEKTYIDFLQLQAEMCIKEEDYKTAAIYVHQAIKIVRTENMKYESKKLNELKSFVLEKDSATIVCFGDVIQTRQLQ